MKLQFSYKGIFEMRIYKVLDFHRKTIKTQNIREVR